MKNCTPHHLGFFLTLLLISSVSFLATDLYLPSLPAIQEGLHTTKRATQLSLSLYMASWALSQLFYGPFSDFSGRRKMVLGSLSISFLGTFVCLLAPNILSLLLGRILQGLGFGGTTVYFRTALRDVYSGEELSKRGSWVAIATALFMAVAPALGGYLQHFFGWRSCFFFLELYIICLFYSIVRFIPETNQHLNPLALRKDILLTNVLHILKNPIFLGYTLVASCTLGGLSAYLIASPFLFEQGLNLTPVQYGALAWIIGGTFGAGGACNIFLLRRIGRHRTLVVGIGAILLSGVSMLALSLLGFFDVLVIMLPMGIFCMGAAMSFGNSFAGAFQPFAKIAGMAASLYGCVQIFFGSLVSGLVSLLHEENQRPLALILITLALLSYLGQLWAFSYAKKM